MNAQEKAKTMLSRLNKKKHMIGVPDLHGSWEATQTTLELITNLDIPAVFLGDYSDRGTSTFKTIELLLTAQKKRTEDWFFLLGNHELLLIEGFATGEAKIADSKYPSAYDEYIALGGLPQLHLEFLKNLLPYHESQSLIFVHGGIEKSFDLPIAEIPVEELVWTYDVSPLYHGKKLVRGHHVIVQPREFSNHISLDTGVGYGKYLSLGILDDSPRKRGKRLMGWIEISPSGEVLNAYQLG